MNTSSNDGKYDHTKKSFEYWSNLAKTDPARFEEERLTEIERVISQAAPERQQSLRQLQWTIDGERRKATNPYSAMIRLNKMMWDHVCADDGLLSTKALWEKVAENFDERNKQLCQLGKIVESVISQLEKE